MTLLIFQQCLAHPDEVQGLFEPACRFFVAAFALGLKSPALQHLAARWKDNVELLASSHQSHLARLLLEEIAIAQTRDPSLEGKVGVVECHEILAHECDAIPLLDEPPSGLDRHGTGESQHEHDGDDLGAHTEPESRRS